MTYPNLDELLADQTVDVVVNLTIHHAHAEVTEKCLDAGKHVYTEKPLALSLDDAQRLVNLAEQKGLRLSSAPITYMGEAQQTAWKELRGNKLGPVRLAYAEINQGRIESWHPNPVPFYEVGIVWDVGIYPITVLTALLGRVQRVTAFGHIVHSERKTLAGEGFRITTPDTVVAVLLFDTGSLLRLSGNFYTNSSRQGSSIELHGDAGSIYVASWDDFGATVEFTAHGGKPQPIPLLREPFNGVELGRGLHELASAICEDRLHRATATHAAHVIEIIEAIHESIKTGQTITMTTG